MGTNLLLFGAKQFVGRCNQPEKLWEKAYEGYKEKISRQRSTQPTVLLKRGRILRWKYLPQ